MADHTPGPWEVLPRGHNGIDAMQVWPEKIGEGRICTVLNSHRQAANARLISTSPDGLALAEKILATKGRYSFAAKSEMEYCGPPTNEDWQAIVAAARALKDKAKGRT